MNYNDIELSILTAMFLNLLCVYICYIYKYYLCYNVLQICHIIFQWPLVFSTGTWCAGLQPLSNRSHKKSFCKYFYAVWIRGKSPVDVFLRLNNSLLLSDVWLYKRKNSYSWNGDFSRALSPKENNIWADVTQLITVLA